MAGFKAHKPDGTEGTAILKMKYEEGKKEITIQIYGCIVKNDANLKNFIQNNYKPGANLTKFENTKYYFYTCDSENASIIEKARIIETTIHCHRFSNPNEGKISKLKYSPLDVVKVQEHIFMLCDSDKFNKSKFLKEHSKELQVPESVDAVIKKEKIYGLIVINGGPKFIPLKLNVHRSSDVFEVDAECYEQLEDTGPVLLNDRKTLVGSYIKSSDYNRITISVFGHIQGPGNVSHASHQQTVTLDFEGGFYDLSPLGVLLEVLPHTVTYPAKVTCRNLNPVYFPAPAKDDETLVSYVKEFTSTTLKLQKPIIVTLKHCGPSKKEGYETLVKELKHRKITNEWEQIEEMREDSYFARQHFKSCYIQMKVSQLTTLAVVSRVIRDTFKVTEAGCVVRSSVCDDVTLEFPVGAVDQTFYGTMKLYCIPDHTEILDGITAFPCPLIVIDGFEGITFNLPVKIRLPHPYPAGYPSGDVRVLCMEAPHEWKDITDQVQCINEHESFLELEVKHFSGLWAWIYEVPLTVASSLSRYLFKHPQHVRFAVFKENDPRNTASLTIALVCLPIKPTKQFNSKDAMKDLEEQGRYTRLGYSTSNKPLRPNDKAYIKVEGCYENSDEDIFLMLIENEVCRKEILLRKSNSGGDLVISFLKRKDGDVKENLCEIRIDEMEICSVAAGSEGLDCSGTSRGPSRSVKLKTPSLNLSDNQKRWIVVGICLNKTLLPNLRDFLAPEMIKHYDDLKTKHNIDFDVKSEVDLGKLYLKPYMAKFTGFDDTCDLSAVLGILSSASVFSSDVQDLARKVRDDVRNEWGHCDFLTWDDAKFTSSFQLMDSLIRELKLPSDEEKRIIDELKDWETRGMDLCIGNIMDADGLLEFVKYGEVEIKRLPQEVKHLGSQEEGTKQITEALHSIREAFDKDKEEIYKTVEANKREIEGMKIAFKTDKEENLKRMEALEGTAEPLKIAFPSSTPEPSSTDDTPDIHTEPEDTPDTYTEPVTVFAIDETGGSYSVLRRGIFLEVPPNAVSKPAKITCKVQPNDCSRTLAGDEETLVSFVELGPKDMEIIQPITVTLVHSGPSRDLGYDTVVKAFNQEKNDWEEIEELRNRSKYSESDYIQVKISKMTKLAVVSRLVTDRFEVTPNKKCVVTSSVCDDITLEFPQGTVDKTVEGTMKVILVDKNYFYNKYNLYPCPILCVNGFKGISFQKSPMIRLPRPCKETHPGSKTSLFCLEDAKKSDGNEMSWEDITDEVDIKEDEAFVFVELHVRHFSWYSAFTGESRPSRSLISSFFDYFSQTPRNVYFAAFKNNEDPYKSFRLKLMCVENSNEELKTKDFTGYKRLMGKTGAKAMRIGDEAYVKIEGDFKKEETSTGPGFLRFLGNEGYYEEFYVCKNSKKVMKGNEKILILFHTENQEYDLCTLPYKIQQVKTVETPSAASPPPARPSSAPPPPARPSSAPPPPPERPSAAPPPSERPSAASPPPERPSATSPSKRPSAGSSSFFQGLHIFKSSKK